MAQKKSTKLGRNPFQQKTSSQIGRMIEASFTKGPLAQVGDSQKSQLGLFDRLNEMKFSLDMRELVRSLKGHDKSRDKDG